ncbi:hypothetical protein GN958_ATG05897 [Phytophthora infestans]|uniref:Uncharacterized protein n=1 Tax=Phytophthora infestans TaxID=4787 RepID=A0A8S9UX11_PHYIN|nr:hypothetical protein GN958_ATG06807 [Phytophthora infestans]KAF4144913.1 hypothetical protein GN958_ATG05897 [Phytophthora infestans]
MYTGPEKANYTIKYTTKHQQDLENPWALNLHAFNKANRVLSNETDTQAAAGRRRIQSMCCTLSNPHEVSAPMACLYVIKGTVMYSSHEFVKLPLPTVSKALFQQDEQLDIVLEGATNQLNFKPSSIWLDYIFRPATLESVDLMTFAKNWCRKKSKRGVSFLKEHPHFGTHTIAGSTSERVVTISHKRLPDVRRSNLPKDELLRYQQSVMALFRLFRCGADFDTNCETFGTFFEQWWATEAPPSARTIDDPEAARQLRYEADLDDDRESDSTGFDMQDADEDDGDSDESEPEDMDEII